MVDNVGTFVMAMTDLSLYISVENVTIYFIYKMGLVIPVFLSFQ